MANKEAIKEILFNGTDREARALFSFTKEDSAERIVQKFNIFIRYFFIKYLSAPDAPFHREIDLRNAQVYRGDQRQFLNICFRGASKTTRTKLFVAFCILNDLDHQRKYIKILARDKSNSTQFVTDIYNMLVQPRINALYPDTFTKTTLKREETMNSFTTSLGVKVTAGTVGTSQRGDIQDESRPDLLILDDFEDRMTLRSAVITKALADNIEEAKNGLSKNGSTIYLCNYISERGNVHNLVQTVQNQMIVPIKADGKPTWDTYTMERIDQIEQDVEDFQGEYMCQPSASLDVLFDRETLEKMEKRTPIKTVAGFRMYREYDPSHRYAAGADVAGGVGLDSSTSVFIDFDTMPAQVVATSDNNQIKPDTFGDELARQAAYYGECLVAPEKNNHGHATIGRLRQIYDNIYTTEGKDVTMSNQMPKEFGWHTNALTKPKMLFALGKAIEMGHLVLNDEKLITEAEGYTRNDLIDKDPDPRLITRHSDLLIACAIAWMMKDHAQVARIKEQEQVFEEEKPLYPDIWS